MRDFFTSSIAVPMTVTLIASILATAIPLQQQASAFEIKDFKKLTHAFEKNVISGVWNPGDSLPMRELVDAYGLDVMRLQPPDPVPGWLVCYIRKEFLNCSNTLLRIINRC